MTVTNTKRGVILPADWDGFVVRSFRTALGFGGDE